jgi:hypothetical protein
MRAGSTAFGGVQLGLSDFDGSLVVGNGKDVSIA